MRVKDKNIYFLNLIVPANRVDKTETHGKVNRNQQFLYKNKYNITFYYSSNDSVHRTTTTFKMCYF